MLPPTDLPVVGAPMAGGATTPALVAAVTGAGGLGVLAGGYLAAASLRDQIAATRELTSGPFGVNLFVPWEPAAAAEAVADYASSVRPDARRLGVELGEPRWDDDDWPAKLELLLTHPVPLVSLTFGCPGSAVTALQRAGSAVAVTVTTAAEAAAAVAAGADALQLQGAEAGAHRGSWTPDAPAVPLETLLADVGALTELPLIAAGGLATAPDVRRALAAGASYAQVGTALLRSPESGAQPAHKAALVDTRFTETTLTRTFTGRRARGLANDFIRSHADAEIEAYPQVHHLTRPLRAAAAKAGDTDRMALWAGAGHSLAQDAPAAWIVRDLVQ